MNAPDAAPDENDSITFSFGENFKKYLDNLRETNIREAVRDLGKWIGRDKITGHTVLDIGCGSGIHSLAFHFCGAKAITSFDHDINSVEASKRLWSMADKPMHWTIMRGSILDPDFVKRLAQHDIVYAWGVLHHTGNLWRAMETATTLVKPGGLLWISLYTKGPRFQKDLALKKKYNAATRFGKKLMETPFILRAMRERLRNKQNPFAWNQTKRRGMNVYHDIVDWLGGLPYEVASPEEVHDFLCNRGFKAEKIEPRAETDCSIYLYSKQG